MLFSQAEKGLFGTLFGNFDVDWVLEESKPDKTCTTPLSMVRNPLIRAISQCCLPMYPPLYGDTTGRATPAPGLKVDVSNVIICF